MDFAGQEVTGPLEEATVVVGGDVEVVRWVLREGVERPDVRPHRLLAASRTLNLATEDALTELRLATVMTEQDVEVRSVKEGAGASLLLGDVRGAVILPTPAGHVCTTLSDPETVATLRESYAGAWQGGDEYSTAVTPLAETLRIATDRLGAAFAEDLQTVLNRVDTLGTDADPTDIVEVGLVLAARHRMERYPLSKFFEDTGLASNATITLRKQALAEMGLLRAERSEEGTDPRRERLTLAVAGADPTVDDCLAHLGVG